MMLSSEHPDLAAKGWISLVQASLGAIFSSADCHLHGCLERELVLIYCQGHRLGSSWPLLELDLAASCIVESCLSFFRSGLGCHSILKALQCLLCSRAQFAVGTRAMNEIKGNHLRKNLLYDGVQGCQGQRDRERGEIPSLPGDWYLY